MSSLAALLLLGFLGACARPPLPGAVRLDGSPFAMADLRGKPAWVEFWAPFDPASRRRVQDLAELQRRHPEWAGRVRFVGVAVNAGGLEVRDALPRSGVPPFEVVLDSGFMAEAVGVTVVPTTLWVEEDGRMRILREGYLEPALLEKTLEPLITGNSRASGR